MNDLKLVAPVFLDWTRMVRGRGRGKVLSKVASKCSMSSV